MADCLCFPRLRRELPPDDSRVAMSADLHFYGDVLHDWPLDACQKLVGRILMHEMLLAEDRQGPAVVPGLACWSLICGRKP